MTYMTGLNFGLVIVLLMLHYPLWIGTNSLADVYRVQQQKEKEQQTLAAQYRRNQALLAEIRYLQHHSDAVAARARYDLGLVSPGETYFQLIRHD